jgi:hypothetical protein
MDPLTAAILIGGTAAIGMYQANEQQKAIAKAQKRAKDEAVKNQNALVEQGFEKRRKTMGLGEPGAAGGLVASQSGGVLTSVTNGNQASGL